MSHKFTACVLNASIPSRKPPISRFGGRAKKKGVIDKLKGFFDRFFGLGSESFAGEEQKNKAVVYDRASREYGMVAESAVGYDYKKGAERRLVNGF